METKFYFSVIIAFIVFFGKLNAQNTFPSTGPAGIGTTSPNPSSLLEVVSTSKGVLIPRMTLTQRNAIASPATGLLIYQTTNTPGFYYYSGTAWTAISAKGANTSLSNLKSPTAVNTDLLTDSDNVRNLGSPVNSWKDIYLDGSVYLGGVRFLAYHTGTGTENTAVGAAVLNANTTGPSNTGVGYNALFLNTTGAYNTATGGSALYSNTTGYYNMANGFDALYHNTTGVFNTADGAYTLSLNTTGDYNTANGENSLYSNT